MFVHICVWISFGVPIVFWVLVLTCRHLRSVSDVDTVSTVLLGQVSCVNLALSALIDIGLRNDRIVTGLLLIDYRTIYQILLVALV